MGWFLAKTYDGCMRKEEEACLRAWRAELLGNLGGDILEIGAGTGANVEHYPQGKRAHSPWPSPTRTCERASRRASRRAAVAIWS